MPRSGPSTATRSTNRAMTETYSACGGAARRQDSGGGPERIDARKSQERQSVLVDRRNGGVQGRASLRILPRRVEGRSPGQDQEIGEERAEPEGEALGAFRSERAPHQSLDRRNGWGPGEGESSSPPLAGRRAEPWAGPRDW